MCHKQSPEQGRKRCQPCLDKTVQYKNRQTEKKRAAGLQPFAWTEQKKERERLRNQTPERKEYNRNRRKKRNEERKALGLCQDCTRPAADNRSRCTVHLEKKVGYATKSRAKKKLKLSQAEAA